MFVELDAWLNDWEGEWETTQNCTEQSTELRGQLGDSDSEMDEEDTTGTGQEFWILTGTHCCLRHPPHHVQFLTFP